MCLRLARAPAAGTAPWALPASLGRLCWGTVSPHGGRTLSPLRAHRSPPVPPSALGETFVPFQWLSSRGQRDVGALTGSRPHHGPALTPVSPAGRSQRSPQAAGLAEILPEGRGAVQHPQLDVAQARRRQRGAGRGGAQLPPEQPDVSGGAGPGAGAGLPPQPQPPPAAVSLPAPWHALVCFVQRKTNKKKKFQ